MKLLLICLVLLLDVSKALANDWQKVHEQSGITTYSKSLVDSDFMAFKGTCGPPRITRR